MSNDGMMFLKTKLDHGEGWNDVLKKLQTPEKHVQ